MTEENCVDYERITKYVFLKCDAFSSNRSLKCSSIWNYPGWKKCTKVALCFKCDKEEHAINYQQQDSSEQKENEEVAGTSRDAELVITGLQGDFTNTKKSDCQRLDEHWTLNVTRQSYLIHMLWDFIVKSNEELKILLSSDIFLEKYPNFVNIS